MRISLVPVILLLLAVVSLGFSLFGPYSYDKVIDLRQTVELQQQKNAALQAKVEQLKRDVVSIQEDERALEKAARNELGLARPDDLIFVFEKDKALQ